jgi:hypothetical protein
MDFLKNFRFMAKKINPNKFTLIIDETHIVFISPNGVRRRPPYIRKY